MVVAHHPTLSRVLVSAVLSRVRGERLILASTTVFFGKNCALSQGPSGVKTLPQRGGGAGLKPLESPSWGSLGDPREAGQFLWGWGSPGAHCQPLR